MNNNTVYNLIGINDLKTVGTVRVAGSLVTFNVNDDYKDGMFLMSSRVKETGGFETVKVRNDTVLSITGADTLYVDALKEDSLLKLGIFFY